MVAFVDEVLDTSDRAVSSLLKSGGGVAYIEAAIFGITGRWRRGENFGNY